jgi:hypothetical protein
VKALDSKILYDSGHQSMILTIFIAIEAKEWKVEENYLGHRGSAPLRAAPKIP